MGQVIDIKDFFQQLRQEGLMVAPEEIVARGMAAADLEKKRRAALAKKALTFKEIAEAQLLGPVQVKAVKVFIMKYKKPGELIETTRGQIKVYKVLTAAVIRMAKMKNLKWD